MEKNINESFEALKSIALAAGDLKGKKNIDRLIEVLIDLNFPQKSSKKNQWAEYLESLSNKRTVLTQGDIVVLENLKQSGSLKEDDFGSFFIQCLDRNKYALCEQLLNLKLCDLWREQIIGNNVPYVYPSLGGALCYRYEKDNRHVKDEHFVTLLEHLCEGLKQRPLGVQEGIIFSVMQIAQSSCNWVAWSKVGKRVEEKRDVQSVLSAHLQEVVGVHPQVKDLRVTECLGSSHATLFLSNMLQLEERIVSRNAYEMMLQYEGVFEQKSRALWAQGISNLMEKYPSASILTVQLCDFFGSDKSSGEIKGWEGFVEQNLCANVQQKVPQQHTEQRQGERVVWTVEQKPQYLLATNGVSALSFVSLYNLDYGLWAQEERKIKKIGKVALKKWIAQGLADPIESTALGEVYQSGNLQRLTEVAQKCHVFEAFGFSALMCSKGLGALVSEVVQEVKLAPERHEKMKHQIYHGMCLGLENALLWERSISDESLKNNFVLLSPQSTLKHFLVSSSKLFGESMEQTEARLLQHMGVFLKSPSAPLDSPSIRGVHNQFWAGNVLAALSKLGFDSNAPLRKEVLDNYLQKNGHLESLKALHYSLFEKANGKEFVLSYAAQVQHLCESASDAVGIAAFECFVRQTRKDLEDGSQGGSRLFTLFKSKQEAIEVAQQLESDLEALLLSKQIPEKKPSLGVSRL